MLLRFRLGLPTGEIPSLGNLIQIRHGLLGVGIRQFTEEGVHPLGFSTHIRGPEEARDLATSQGQPAEGLLHCLDQEGRATVHQDGEGIPARGHGGHGVTGHVGQALHRRPDFGDHFARTSGKPLEVDLSELFDVALGGLRALDEHVRDCFRQAIQAAIIGHDIEVVTELLQLGPHVLKGTAVGHATGEVAEAVADALQQALEGVHPGRCRRATVGLGQHVHDDGLGFGLLAGSLQLFQQALLAILELEALPPQSSDGLRGRLQRPPHDLGGLFNTDPQALLLIDHQLHRPGELLPGHVGVRQ
ncbi:hypothetical protein FQZ97_709030 [compost metagenome]